jgi:hypothetical protein
MTTALMQDQPTLAGGGALVSSNPQQAVGYRLSRTTPHARGRPFGLSCELVEQSKPDLLSASSPFDPVKSGAGGRIRANGKTFV